MHCFSNLFLVKNSSCFRQIYCLSSGVSTLFTQQQVFVMLVLQTVWTFDITDMTNIYCCVETPDDGQQSCLNHVEIFIKNKFEKQCILLTFSIGKKNQVSQQYIQQGNMHPRNLCCLNTFAASYLNTQRLNNSCLKSRQRRPQSI